MGNQKSSSLPPQLVEELEVMTSFSYAEINDLYRQFRHDCPDLKMSKIQFRELYRGTFPNGDPDKFADLVFKSFDREDRGYIDFRQFLTTLSAQLKGNFEKKLDWLFGLYDTEHVDYITKEALLEMITAIHDLHVGALPSEDQLSPDEVASHIMKQAGQLEHPGRIYRNDFIRAAMTSNTLASILQGTIKAADSPYLRRKERRGSLGIPLHHGAQDKRLEHLRDLELNDRRGSNDSHHSGGSRGSSGSPATTLAVPGAAGAGAARRPSLTPDMLDFNTMLNKR
jgi:Ca2+-binding EF-hand superfamily protein